MKTVLVLIISTLLFSGAARGCATYLARSGALPDRVTVMYSSGIDIRDILR